jgi:hypothetical protein
VPGSELNVIEPALGERKQIDCVEIYLPKSIEFLSELYQFLREKVTNRLNQVVLDGFSIYEVDGVFQGEHLWEQRTLVIRLLFIRPAGSPASVVSGRITDLGRAIATRVATREEEIWICQYPQILTVFPGLKRILSEEGRVMRIVVHEYADGGRTAYETSDDGGDYLGDLDGQRQVGKRICAFVEGACDSNEKGMERLLDALAWLTEEIKKRKENLVSA